MAHDREPQRDEKPPVGWLLDCLDASRRINDALLRNDLAALEGSLELESTLLSSRPDAKLGNLAIPASIAREIQSLNERNRELIINGFDFARTLLDVIRPPATYNALGSSQSHPSGTYEHRISVKG